MKKHIKLSTIIVLTCLIAFVSINANATDATDSPNLQQILGIQPDAQYANVDLTTTAEGSVITATVEDPSKIGGCLRGDRVELINLGNEEWKITRLLSGSGFIFNVYKEDGVMKITKTETFGKRLDDKTKLIPKNSFELGLDARYLKYEEKDVMEEDGWLYGIVGRYIYHGSNKFMFETSVNYVFGELEYDGETLGGTPVEEDADDWIIEWRGLIGGDYRIKNSSMITFFTGVGYRYWNDEIDAPGGYEREIQYWYLPIGVKTISSLNNSWTCGISIEYDLFLSGEVKSHLSDVHPSLNDPKNDQDFGEGYGVKVSLKFDKKLTSGAGVSFEPYITYWDIDKSDTSTLTFDGIPIGYVFEPANETTAYGLRLNISFF
jgi:hypothetical protein